MFHSPQLSWKKVSKGMKVEMQELCSRKNDDVNKLELFHHFVIKVRYEIEIL